MTVHLDTETALAELRKTIDAHPEGDSYVYDDACVYVSPEDAAPRCILGHLFTRLGVPASFFLETTVDDRTSSDPVNNKSLADESYSLRPSQLAAWVTFTDQAVKVLATAQLAQDSGVSWGEAYQEAQAKVTAMVSA